MQILKSEEEKRHWQRKEALGLPVNFRIGDAEKLPFAHNSFASNPAIRKKVS
jgi:hypothetical protein